MKQKILLTLCLLFILVLILPKTIKAQSISDGFDYPIGKPNGVGYNDAQDFGTKNYNFGGRYHLGEDWNGNGGGDSDLESSIYSISSGVVILKDYRKTWGNVVIIQHTLPDNSKVNSFYGHLKDIYISIGETVSKGQQIGTMGKGDKNIFPAHLHFEIRTDISIGVDYGYGAYKPPGWTDPSEFIDSHRQLLSPPQPVTLSAGEITHNSMTLNWTKNQSAGFQSYKLYRAEASPVTESSTLATTAQDENQLSFTDTSLTPEKTYYYKIFTCNVANQCTGSNEISTQTQKDPLDKGKIVYVSKVGNNFQLFSMNGNGTNQHQILSTNCNDKGPKWSPDGKKILFSSMDPATQKRQVFLIDEDGTNLKKVTSAKYSAEQADWFPDGNNIVYVSSELNSSTKELFVLDISSADNLPKSLTPTTLYSYNPSVSGDGTKIVFSANYVAGGQKGGIFSINSDGTGLIQLTQDNDTNPDISPDNQKMIFSSSRATKNNMFQDVYIATEEVPGVYFNLTGPSWSSNEDASFSKDSKKIVYSKKETETSDFEIVTRDLETDKTETLTNNTADDKEPDWFEE